MKRHEVDVVYELTAQWRFLVSLETQLCLMKGCFAENRRGFRACDVLLADTWEGTWCLGRLEKRTKELLEVSWILLAASEDLC